MIGIVFLISRFRDMHEKMLVTVLDKGQNKQEEVLLKI